MTFKRLPTLKEVGAAAGVTAATASMALRRDPRISMETQKRVQRAAADLGYSPDPILSALVSRRVKNKIRKTFANLAILIDERWLPDGHSSPWIESFLNGATQMAKRLGYQVSPFYYPRDLAHGVNADRILHARGIRGIVFFPLPGEQQTGFTVDWNHYACVVIGHPKLPKMLHRAGSDAFAAMNLVCQKLREYNYKRVGLVHEHHQETELRYEFLGALAKESLLYSKRTFHVVPPHLPERLQRSAFLAWLKKHRPEAIITVEERLLHWLREEGWLVPEDIGIVFLNTHTLRIPNASGTLLLNSATGENAIELLHNQLQQGEAGFPDTAKTMLTYPHWQDGGTLRKQNRDAPN